MKYLALKIDENLNWKDQTHDIVTKLNRANALLYKIRNYVSFNTVKTIYFAIFDSHINYANLIWGQNPNSKLRVMTLQKKTLSIINNLQPILNNWFIFCSEIYNYNTFPSSNDKLFKPSYRTDSYGKRVGYDYKCY